MPDFAELTDEIHNLPDKIKAEALDILLRNGELIAGLAQIRVHVNTGKLRDTIKATLQGDSVVITAGDVTTPYAAIIEAKYPFLSPSVAEVAPQITEELRSKIQAVINNVGT